MNIFHCVCLHTCMCMHACMCVCMRVFICAYHLLFFLYLPLLSQLSLREDDDVFPVTLLLNSAFHLFGPSRGLGAILCGYSGIRTFKPQVRMEWNGNSFSINTYSWHKRGVLHLTTSTLCSWLFLHAQKEFSSDNELVGCA